MAEFIPVDPQSVVGSGAPGLPPIDLPKEEGRRRQPLRIEVRPSPREPYAEHKLWGEEEREPAGEPYAGHPLWGEQEAKRLSRDIGPGEAATRGAIEGLTFGAAPAIAGLGAAGGIGEHPTEGIEGPSDAGGLISGLVNLGLDHFLSPEGKSTRAYRQARDELAQTQQEALEQNPGAYIGGQVAGALALPIPGAMAARGASAGARLARSLKAGTIGGGLYGGGTALGAGEEPLDIAKDVAIGGGTGLLAGGLSHGIIEAGGAALRRGRDIIQGAISPRTIAERKLGEAVRTAQRTGTLGLQPHEYAAALADQMPVHAIDIGGDATRDLGRAASNLSSEARQIIGGPLAERQEARTERFVDRVHQLMNGTLDSGADKLTLTRAAEALNGPRYRHAYARGDFPIGTDPELQRLMGSDYIKEAMKAAVRTGKDRAIRERSGAFNPGVHVTADGRLIFAKGPSGVPTYPNIQYWDYVQRELRDMAEESSSKSKRALIEGLRGDLNRALDATVPEFGAARAGAAKFFGAQDAIEAGQNFALHKGEFRDVRDSKRAIAQFSPPERELFARSFTDQISEALKDKPDWGTIKKLFTSPRAVEKIEAAIGPARARELDVSLRAETMARKTEEKITGNSTSLRQWSDMARLAGHGLGHGAGGAGALAAYEIMKEGHADPKHLIAAALTYGLFRTGARHVDNNVAIHLAHALMSEDPVIANRAVRAISRSPALLKALRAGTEAGARVTAHNAGPAGMTAGMATLYNEAMKSEPHEEASDDRQVIQDNTP